MHDHVAGLVRGGVGGVGRVGGGARPGAWPGVLLFAVVFPAAFGRHGRGRVGDERVPQRVGGVAAEQLQVGGDPVDPRGALFAPHWFRDVVEVALVEGIRAIGPQRGQPLRQLGLRHGVQHPRHGCDRGVVVGPGERDVQVEPQLLQTDVDPLGFMPSVFQLGRQGGAGTGLVRVSLVLGKARDHGIDLSPVRVDGRAGP